MASGGRTRVYIDATAEQLEREVLKAQRALERLGREGAENGMQASRGMDKATAATSRYARVASGAAAVTSRVGNAARTAAPYLGAGLALGLAKSVIEAREAEKALAQTEAVIKSTGGAANVTAGHVQELANQISLKSGIDDEAIQSGENLLLTFKRIRDEAGKGNDIFSQSTQVITDMSVALGQDLKSSAIQVGKALNDPKVGLTALSRVGVTFTEQTKERITALQDEGKMLQAQKIILAELTSEFGGSAAAQADSFDKLKVAAENFAEQVGGEVTPILSDMSDQLTEILSDKQLSGDQRVDALGKFFEEWVGKGIDALEDAAPEIAHYGAEIAKDMIGAFVRSWWNSDLLGKLFLGAGALRLFGGPGVFGKLGVAAGRQMGMGMGPAAATTVASSGGPAMSTAGRGLGKLAGAGMLIGIGLMAPEIAGEIKKIVGGTKLGDTDREGFASMLESYFGAEEGSGDFLGRFAVRLRTEVGDLVFDSRTEKVIRAKGALLQRTVGKTYAEAFQTVEKIKSGKIAREVGFDELIDGFDRVGRKAKGAQGDLRDYFKTFTGDLKDASKDTRDHGRLFSSVFGSVERDLAAGGRDLDGYYNDLSRNFGKADKKGRGLRDDMGANLTELSRIVGQALQTIGANTNSVLGGLGAEKINYKVISADPNGKSLGRQAGGSVFQVPGTGTGDSFHTLVPDGTFILNRNAASAFFGAQRGGPVPVVLEPGELAFSPAAVAQMGGFLQWANGAAPRFASGGLAGAHATVSNFVRDLMGRFGGGVGSGYRPGGTSLHSTGQAIDYSPSDWAGAAAAVNRAGPSLLEGIYNPGVNGGPSVSWDTGAQVSPSFWGSATWADHTDHIHIAISDGAKVGAVAAARQIKRLMLDGPNGPLKNIGQGAIDKATKAANAYIAKHAPSQVGAFEGSQPGRPIKSLPPALAKWNRTFPGAVLQNDPGAWMGLAEMPFNVAAAIAEWAGMPGVTMAQVSKGEGGLKPGSMGDDNGDGQPDGYGWLAITRPYGDAYGVNRYGGYEGMLNPVSNAIVAKGMYDAQGLSAWYGQRFVTDTNAHYSGPLLGKARGGFVGMAGGGKTDGKWTHDPMPPLTPFGPALPALPKGIKPGQLTYEQQMTFFGIGLDYASGTASTSDDLAILQAQLALVQKQTDLVGGELANLHLTKQDREKARRMAADATSEMRKRFMKDGKLSAGEKRKLDAAAEKAMKESGRGILDKRRAELLDELAGLTSELSSTKDSIDSLNEQTNADLKEAMVSLAEAIKEQNELASRESAVQNTQLVRALADILSGEIGGRVTSAGMTAGYGQVAAA